MDHWNDYFVAQAGASAALAGLVFVGVSINLDKILSSEGYGLPNRALEALIVLMSVLTLSSLMLAPGQRTTVIGAEVLAVRVVDWGSIAAIQLHQSRHWRVMDSNLRQAFVLRVAVGQAATLPFVLAGVAVLGWGAGGLYWLVPGVVFSFLVALFDAWVLLIEINR